MNKARIAASLVVAFVIGYLFGHGSGPYPKSDTPKEQCVRLLLQNEVFPIVQDNQIKLDSLVVAHQSNDDSSREYWDFDLVLKDLPEVTYRARICHVTGAADFWKLTSVRLSEDRQGTPHRSYNGMDAKEYFFVGRTEWGNAKNAIKPGTYLYPE